jgi:hypothetical protein
MLPLCGRDALLVWLGSTSAESEEDSGPAITSQQSAVSSQHNCDYSFESILALGSYYTEY